MPTQLKRPSAAVFSFCLKAMPAQDIHCPIKPLPAGAPGIPADHIALFIPGMESPLKFKTLQAKLAAL